MEALPTICLLLCSDVFECDPQHCVDHFISHKPSLSVNCRDYRPFNISALIAENGTHALGDDLDSVKLDQCSLMQWSDSDTIVLADKEVAEFLITRTNISTFSPLSVLKGVLTSLTATACWITDAVAETIPASDLVNIEIINLSDNQLTILPESLRDFRAMTKLDVSHNRLVILDLAQYSTSLITVISSHNALESAKFSQNQVDLQSVDLSSNALSNLDWIKSMNFPRGCRRVDVSYNRISSVAPESFSFLTDSEYYNISYNNISDISSLIELNNFGNETIDLSHNPLLCDCESALLARVTIWRAQYLPDCKTPALFEGYSLIKMADEICLDAGGEKIVDNNKRGSEAGGVVLILGGICCMFGAVAMVGYIAQTRRAAVVVLHRENVKTLNEAPKAQLFSNISGDMDKQCVDQYLQRRRIDPAESEQLVLDKLLNLQREDVTYTCSSTIDVCLEFVMVKDITIDKVDAEDFCSLLIREWPLAPCTTPHPEYSAMYYNADMEEWPMTALNTKACSQTNISCVLVGVNQALNAADKTQSDMFTIRDKSVCALSVFEPAVPPNSIQSLNAADSYADIDPSLINNV